jgi:hypothetical protein
MWWGLKPTPATAEAKGRNERGLQVACGQTAAVVYFALVNSFVCRRGAATPAGLFLAGRRGGYFDYLKSGRSRSCAFSGN